MSSFLEFGVYVSPDAVDHGSAYVPGTALIARDPPNEQKEAALESGLQTLVGAVRPK